LKNRWLYLLKTASATKKGGFVQTANRIEFVTVFFYEFNYYIIRKLRIKFESG
jgi:hypothetical protein